MAGSVNDNGCQLSDDEMVSNCLNFLFAAYDTTSLTLTCASHLLATNPRVQDKLCTLLDDYWSQHEVCENNKVHKYSLASWCASVWMTDRIAGKFGSHYILGFLNLPANSYVAVSSHSIHTIILTGFLMDGF